MSPAPVMRTTARAIWATTRTFRPRDDPTPPEPFEPSLRLSVRSTRDEARAGRRPKATTVESVTTRVVETHKLADELAWKINAIVDDEIDHYNILYGRAKRPS